MPEVWPGRLLRVDKLAEMIGGDAMLTDWLWEITKDCPAGVGKPGLIKVV